MEEVFSARYRKYLETGELVKDSECEIQLLKDSLVISSSGEEELKLKFSELTSLSFKNHKISFSTPDKKRFELYYLSDYSTISETVRNERSSEIVKNLLLTGIKRQGDFKCQFALFKKKDAAPYQDTGEIRLYDTFLVLIPLSEELDIFLYSNLKSSTSDPENERVILNFYTGERLEITILEARREEFEGLLYALFEVRGSSSKKRFSEFLSGVSSEVAENLAELVREGRSVEKKAVEKIDPLLWGKLENLIGEEGGYKKTYRFLKGRARLEENIRIGIREKSGKLNIWYQIPIETKSGQYIAVEDISLVDHNTFIFKVKDAERTSLSETMELINKNLLFLDFNFSALYMSEGDITEGANGKLKVIFNKFDFLLKLRELFFFKVPFKDYEKWAQDLKIILGV